MPEHLKPYDVLETRFADLHSIKHAQSVLYWDEAVLMSAGGGAARRESLAALATLAHRSLTAPELGDLLDAAEANVEGLNDWQRANLRAMQRLHQRAAGIPEALVQATQIANARCQQIWRTARPADDWMSISQPLAEVVALARENAAALGEALALEPYDALLDTYEKGATTKNVTPIFEDLKTFLPGLIDRVLGEQGNVLGSLEGPFSARDQRRLGEEMMRSLGFDFARGRLDVSHHPFCGGVPDDTRITTRFDDNDFLESFMAVLHETGHALYQQGLPSQWRKQPVGGSLGAAVHESQSLFIEMQIGRSYEFMAFATPSIRRHLSASDGGKAWTAEEIYARAIRVRPDYIRVGADELTYPLHVILRFELEQLLIAGDLGASEIPDAWNDAMTRYLGVSTEGNFADGCMQDVHWFSGLFGYFPTYTLGALMAAQWFAAASASIPDIEAKTEEGNFGPIVAWLRHQIHGQGRLKTAHELLTDVTGEPLNPDYFKKHLQRRYLD
ncbi:MAG: carboxypeptidase M32 [Pseudomonadota bacterium]